jgi:hypothetical protein
LNAEQSRAGKKKKEKDEADSLTRRSSIPLTRAKHTEPVAQCVHRYQEFVHKHKGHQLKDFSRRA